MSVILYFSLEVHVYFTLSQSCKCHQSPVLRSELWEHLLWCLLTSWTLTVFLLPRFTEVTCCVISRHRSSQASLIFLSGWWIFFTLWSPDKRNLQIFSDVVCWAKSTQSVWCWCTNPTTQPLNCSPSAWLWLHNDWCLHFLKLSTIIFYITNIRLCQPGLEILTMYLTDKNQMDPNRYRILGLILIPARE